MIIAFLYYFLLGICSILISYTIGRFLTSFIANSSTRPFQIFYSLVIGILFITTLYAITKSRGKSILILILPIFGIIAYIYRHKISKSSINIKETFKEIQLILILFTVIYIYQSYFFFDFFTDSYKSLHSDSYWYSSISNSQLIWGIENYFTECNYFTSNPIVNGLDPYHYPELWLTAIFSQLYSISTINSYYLINSSILISIYFIGLISLFRSYFSNTWLLIVFSFMLLFMSGITFQFYETIPILKYSKIAADVSPMGLFGLKYSYVLPFILLSFILIKDNKIKCGLIILTIIPLFSIGLLPAIWGGLFLFYCIQIIRKGLIKNKDLLFPFVTLLILFCSFLLFYSCNKSSFSTDFAFTYAINKYYKNGHIMINQFRPFINNSIVYGLRIIVVFSFAFVLGIYLFIKSTKISLLCILIIGCGIITSSFFLGFSDGNQFANNSFIFLTVSSIISISYIFELNKSSAKTTKLSVFTILILTTYLAFWNFNRKTVGNNWYNEDPSFLKEISQTINSYNTIVMVFLDSAGFKKYSFSFWPDHNDMNLVLAYSKSTIIFTLGNPELYLKVNRLNTVDSFAYYAQTPLTVWRNKGSKNTLESFITFYHLKYFYFKKGVNIPKFILQNAQKTIISPITKSKFIILNN